MGFHHALISMSLSNRAPVAEYAYIRMLKSIALAVAATTLIATFATTAYTCGMLPKGSKYMVGRLKPYVKILFLVHPKNATSSPLINLAISGS